jgi:nucleoside-diphosphate-sugar epimerase
VDVKPVRDWWQVHDTAENVVADLRLLDPCRAAVSGATEVYNLAADMGGMGFIETHKAECMLSVLINTHLLVACKNQPRLPRRYFFASSACVYAASKQTSTEPEPLREDDAYPAQPEDGYGWEKLFAERMCRHFLEDYGVQTRVARYHNVYGPHGTWNGGREKAPAAVCRKVAEAKLGKSEPVVTVWGDGRQARSFTFVDDCVEGTIRLTRSNVVDPVNVGSDETVSVERLVGIVEDVAGTGRLGRRYDRTAPQGVRGRTSDNTNVRKLLGWYPPTGLKDGLAPTYRWVEDQVRSTI